MGANIDALKELQERAGHVRDGELAAPDERIVSCYPRFLHTPSARVTVYETPMGAAVGELLATARAVRSED